MTDRDRFRYGFLKFCAQQGMQPEQVRGMVKEATERVKLSVNPLSALSLLYKIPLGIGGYGLLASAGTGALGGHVAAKLTEDEIDPEEVKRQELLSLYRQQAERARRNAARIRYRKPKRKPNSPQLFD